MFKILLGEQTKGFRGKIIEILESELHQAQRLREIGFIPGAPVQILHEAPFSKDPIAVKVRGTVFGLRRQEALQIVVEKS
jgi:ferrous iron transport protein A